MPRAEFFARLGLLCTRGFFDAETCGRLRAEIREASGGPATVLGDQGGWVVKPEVRRVTWTEVSPPTRAEVDRRLTELMPALSRHFGVGLCGHEGPSFLRYGPGDFYLAHRDRDDEPDPAAPEGPGARQVSVVAFLNGEGEAPSPEVFGGGALTFTGLLDDPRLRTRGLPLVPEPGLLIAFRSDVLHAVSPVTHGERYTVVTWYA
jgi:SM-20-related protein